MRPSDYLAPEALRSRCAPRPSDTASPTKRVILSGFRIRPPQGRIPREGSNQLSAAPGACRPVLAENRPPACFPGAADPAKDLFCGTRQLPGPYQTPLHLSVTEIPMASPAYVTATGTLFAPLCIRI